MEALGSREARNSPTGTRARPRERPRWQRLTTLKALYGLIEGKRDKPERESKKIESDYIFLGESESEHTGYSDPQIQVGKNKLYLFNLR